MDIRELARALKIKKLFIISMSINDYITLFYIIPIICNSGIIAFITGENKWGTYRIVMNSLQMRIYGLLTIIFCIYIIYNVLIRWPKIIGGKRKVNEVLKSFSVRGFCFFGYSHL